MTFSKTDKKAQLVAMLAGVPVDAAPQHHPSSQGAPAATQKDADEELAAKMTSGATSRFAQKLIDLKVANTFRVKYRLNKKGAFRAELSTFDGTMVKKLFHKQQKVWSEALDAAFVGLSIDCQGRPARCEQGVCNVCDLYYLYEQFGTWLLPSMRAMTWAKFAKRNSYMSENDQFVFDRAAWDTRLHAWGMLFKKVFATGQSKRVIQNYLHLYISHSGQLMAELNHPLGFDSQQAVEAAHKDIKRAFYGATSHSGGHADATNSLAAMQIMLRSYRVLLYAIRMRCEAVGPESENFKYVQYVLSGIGYDDVSSTIMNASNNLHKTRLTDHMDVQLKLDDDHDLNLPSIRALRELERSTI